MASNAKIDSGFEELYKIDFGFEELYTCVWTFMNYEEKSKISPQIESYKSVEFIVNALEFLLDNCRR